MKLTDIYWFSLFFLPITSLFFGVIQHGVINNIIFIIIIIVISVKVRVLNYNYNDLHIYVLYLIISLFYYLFNYLSFDIILSSIYTFISSISYLILPPLIIVVIRLFYGYHNNLKIVYKLLAVTVILNLLIHILKFEPYTRFIQSYVYSSDFIPRLYGYFGNSMIVGCLSVILTLLALYNPYRIASKMTRRFLIIIGTISTLLSMQRGAWVAYLMSVLIYFFIHYKELSRMKIVLVLGLIIPLVLLLSSMVNLSFSNFDSLFLYLSNRVENIDGAMGERSSQWLYAFENFISNPIGYGIGSFSHKAVSYHDVYAVTDGNYFRILVELGVTGSLIFVFIVFKSLHQSFSKKNWLIFQILLVYYFQALGTNVFDLYLLSHLFYFFLYESLE